MTSEQTPKRIGILGGTSNVITTRYYDMINAASNARLGRSYLGETIIMGMNFGRVADFAMQRDWQGLSDYVSTQVDRLEAAGAELIIGSSNTVHEVMPSVMEGRQTPYLPITKPLITAIKASGLKRIAMFGTMSTMNNGAVMREVMAATGAELIAPNPEEREDINRVIFEELVKNRFDPTSRQRYVDIATRMQNEEGAEGVILGCTEIFLLINQQDLPAMKVFATAELHVQAAVELAFADCG